MNLFIDTHLNDIVIILYANKKIINKEIITNKRENSRLIMPTLQKVVGDNKLSSIIVVNGPGSFTGVRLGVTIAKTLAYTLNIPIRTISSLEAMFVCLDNENVEVAFSDNNGYYIGVFENNINVNNMYLSNKDFLEYQSKHQVIIDVNLDYEKIISYALMKDTINPHQVNPVYIKKLDVEK